MKMNKYLWTLILVLAMVITGTADVIKFQWDYDLANNPEIDGFKLYQRSGEEYVDPPVWIGNTLEAEVDVAGVEGQATTYNYIVRAFKGDTESENSNEVSYTVDRVPPLAVVLNAVYENDVVTFTWDDPDQQNIIYWNIYYATKSGGPYAEFDTVENTGNNLLTASKELIVPVGEKHSYYFTIVAFKTPTLFSPNSNEISITIDKRLIGKPMELRVNVKSKP
jgi:hypothetical protein